VTQQVLRLELEHRLDVEGDDVLCILNGADAKGQVDEAALFLALAVDERAPVPFALALESARRSLAVAK
jgi:hypothetical protein